MHGTGDYVMLAIVVVPLTGLCVLLQRWLHRRWLRRAGGAHLEAWVERQGMLTGKWMTLLFASVATAVSGWALERWPAWIDQQGQLYGLVKAFTPPQAVPVSIASTAQPTNLPRKKHHSSVAVKGATSLELADVEGRWEGYYNCGSGRTRMTLDVSGADTNDALTAIFTFFKDDLPMGQDGAFEVSGTMTRKGAITFKPVQWIDQPAGWYMIGMSGKASSDKQTLSGSLLQCNGSFTLHKESVGQ